MARMLTEEEVRDIPEEEKRRLVQEYEALPALRGTAASAHHDAQGRTPKMRWAEEHGIQSSTLAGWKKRYFPGSGDGRSRGGNGKAPAPEATKQNGAQAMETKPKSLSKTLKEEQRRQELDLKWANIVAEIFPDGIQTQDRERLLRDLTMVGTLHSQVHGS